MRTDELDRILSSEQSLEPSSGFAAAVMDAVRLQASEPTPLPFPWGRFALGLAACVVLAATGTTLALQTEAMLAALVVPLAPLAAVAPELGYVALALLGSLAIARLPRVLVRP